MKLISRYLLKEIVHAFGMFVLAFLTIMLVNEIFDTRQEFLENSPSLGNIVLFLIFSLPENVAKVLPMVGLLGTLMAYGLLAKNREILAMIAAGVSYRRLAAPALLFGLGLSAFALWFNEFVVPASISKARYIEKVVIGGKSETVFTQRRNLFIRGVGDRFYFMQGYLPAREEMLYPTILEVSPDGHTLVERIEARRARLTGGKGDKRHWEFNGAEQWSFNPDGALASYQQYDGPFQLPMEDGLDKFLGKAKRPDEMNLAELMDFVSLLRKRGGEKIDRYATSMHLKMAFPLTCLLMALLGFTVVTDLNARRFARGTFLGLLVAIGYYLLEATLSSLGDDGFLAPVIAGWGAAAIFALVVFLLMQRLEHQSV
jgi:lipopolysaccharide export system permease protein